MTWRSSPAGKCQEPCPGGSVSACDEMSRRGAAASVSDTDALGPHPRPAREGSGLRGHLALRPAHDAEEKRAPHSPYGTRCLNLWSAAGLRPGLVVSGSHSTARARSLKIAETLSLEEAQASWQSSSKFPAALKRGLDAGDPVGAICSLDEVAGSF